MWLTARRAHRSVPRVLVRTWTTLAAHRRASGSSLRVDWWPTRAALLRWWSGLDRTCRQTGSGNNSLLRSVKTDAECLFLVSASHILGIQLDLPNRRHTREAVSRPGRCVVPSHHP